MSDLFFVRRQKSVAIFLLCCVLMPTKGFSGQTTIRLDELSKTFSSKTVNRLDVEKEVTSELLNKTTTSKGHIFVTSGKLRWEILEPQKSLIVFDGSHVWIEQYGNNGVVEIVNKLTLDKKQKKQDLLKLLSGTKWSKILQVSEVNNKKNIYKLKPIDKNSELSDITFIFDESSQDLREIKYRDEVDNLTTLKILKIEKSKDKPSKLFGYKPPKNIKVQNL